MEITANVDVYIIYEKCTSIIQNHLLVELGSYIYIYVCVCIKHLKK